MPASEDNLALQTVGTDSEHASILHQLQEKYAEYLRAFRARDVAGIMSLLASDFIWNLADGSQCSRLETEAALRLQFQTMSSSDQMAIALLEFTSDGTIATVVVQEKSEGLCYEKEECHFVTTESMRETWSRVHGDWQMDTATVLESQTLLLPITGSIS